MCNKIYLVWDKDINYWEQFDSLEAAVCEKGAVDIYEAIPKLLGKFEIKTSIIKAKKGLKQNG